MKPIPEMTCHEIRKADFDAIIRDLGPVGLSRFIPANNLAQGNYNRDRDQWLNGTTIDQIVAEWRRRA